MCLLIETIRIRNGKPDNCAYHVRRMERSRRELFGETVPPDIEKLLRVPDRCAEGIHKCRIIYGREIVSVEYTPYRLTQVGSLKLVASNIRYPHKFEDRSALEKLHGMRGDRGGVLILVNGLVTDTTYANIAFYDGNKWLTPAAPLLRGTARERLLDQGTLLEEEIKGGDIGLFRKASIINAMIDLGECEIDTGNIVE